MKLRFLGGTGTVTGSRYLLSDDKHRMLVDCGMYQGVKTLRRRNWAKFPVAPSTIDAVVLTHGHIDHSGRIPLLVKQGYRGPIYMQNATSDLCEILLLDSASLQARDAQYENKWRKRRKKPLLEPLYSMEDVEQALEGVMAYLPH